MKDKSSYTDLYALMVSGFSQEQAGDILKLRAHVFVAGITNYRWQEAVAYAVRNQLGVIEGNENWPHEK